MWYQSRVVVGHGWHEEVVWSVSGRNIGDAGDGMGWDGMRSKGMIWGERGLSVNCTFLLPIRTANNTLEPPWREKEQKTSCLPAAVNLSRCTGQSRLPTGDAPGSQNSGPRYAKEGMNECPRLPITNHQNVGRQRACRSTVRPSAIHEMDVAMADVAAWSGMLAKPPQNTYVPVSPRGLLNLPLDPSSGIGQSPNCLHC